MIPKQVPATAALAQKQRFSGRLSLASLPRLAAAVMEGEVVADLQLSRIGGYPSLSGSLEGQLGLRCQNCEASYAWELEVAVNLRLVFSEDEERAVMESAEPVLVENDSLPVREIIEDEVLLALPMLSRCKTCQNSGLTTPHKAEPEAVAARRDNPFAVLKDKLKQH